MENLSAYTSIHGDKQERYDGMGAEVRISEADKIFLHFCCFNKKSYICGLIERKNMNRGRKPKPSVTFHMRSSEYGDIKILFTYEGERYACGSTYISMAASDFNMLKSDGSPKNPKNPTNPRIANGILISDLLSYLRRYIINRVEERIGAGESVTEDFLKELCSSASKSMFEQLKVWSSNLEWNKRLHKAMSGGKKSLSKFYEENLSQMFSIELTDDGK